MIRLMTHTGTLTLEYCSDSFHKYKLKQTDGFKIDFVGRVIEAVENFNFNSKIRSEVRLYETSKPDIYEEFDGNIHASYDVIPYQLSEYNSGTDYETVFNVGKIDVTRKLNNYIGKNLTIEIVISEK